MTWRQLRGAGIAALVILGAALAWSWLPEHRVQRVFSNLLTHVEDRNWDKVKAIISPRYEDQWGLKRDELVRLSSEVFRQFFFVEITPIDPEIRVTGTTAELTVKFKLTGKGTPLAEHALNRAAELQQPFLLTWRRESWKPWDWKLASVSQSEIYLDPAMSWE